MELHGQALLDYINGDEDAHYILRRDDGIAYPPIYAKQFFYLEGLPELDRIAVQRCAGKVLDLGAGAGPHSLAIQDRGLDVTSVDISAGSNGRTLIRKLSDNTFTGRGILWSVLGMMGKDIWFPY